MLPARIESSTAARTVAWAILALNAALLVASIRDYRVSIDAGYHISLARLYAAHGTAWWDTINFGPDGRPNLQGPALHVAIAILGTALGGTAESFILANAILAVTQWLGAILTVFYFARRLCGDVAAMFAVALLAGSAFASGSFYVGIPSGWLFISIPWAIHFFLQDRLLATTLILSAGCYMHLGGFLTAPVGVAIAAAFERRWRSLAKAAVATAILTSPYWIHFLHYLSWYRGRHGNEALRLDPLIDVLGVAGLAWALRRPRENEFLLAWAAAPIVWLLQDPGRFVSQSTLAASVLAGIMLAEIMRSVAWPRVRIASASAVVAIATIFPLGIPNLLAEASWDAGLHFPRLMNWDQSRAIAAVIEKNQLNSRLLTVYETSLGPSIAVFTPVVLQRGHWVEVQPLSDRADELSAGVKAYVVPLAPDDRDLAEMQELGLVKVYGGNSNTTVITLERRAGPRQVEPIATKMLEDNADWLSANAINNKMPPVPRLLAMLSRAGVAAHDRVMDQQRFRAGRMELACLVVAYAIETESADDANGLRKAARAFAEMASFLSDGDPVGYIGDAQFQRFRENMGMLASALRGSGSNPFASPEVHQAFDRLFHNFFTAA